MGKQPKQQSDLDAYQESISESARKQAQKVVKSLQRFPVLFRGQLQEQRASK